MQALPTQKSENSDIDNKVCVCLTQSNGDSTKATLVRVSHVILSLWGGEKLNLVTKGNGVEKPKLLLTSEALQ